MELLLTAGFTAFAAFTVAAFKARRWDYQTPLRLAKLDEQRQAPKLVACLLKHFDKLDVRGTGLITARSHDLIDELEASLTDKNLLCKAICNAGPHSFVAFNPWLLAAQQECQLTPVGHKIGSHMELQVVSGGGLTGSAAAFNVEVDDYGISRADLATYVARVNS